MDPIPQEEVPSEDMPKRRAAFKIARGQLIGKGTYGRVYLGMNATTGDLLAVKQARSHNQKAAGHDKGRIKEMAPMPSTSLSTTTCGGGKMRLRRPSRHVRPLSSVLLGRPHNVFPSARRLPVGHIVGSCSSAQVIQQEPISLGSMKHDHHHT